MRFDHDIAAAIDGGASGDELLAKPTTSTTRARYLPTWLLHYRREFIAQDLLAGAIVAIMLIPQSMAYALVAGLPPQYGMYASILPLFAYAALGSSMTLAVGPVAITSLMTAAALAPLTPAGSAEYAAGAALLALLSGAMLFIFGALRLGFLATLLSNPVINGFTSGASLLILLGQIGPLLGIRAADNSVPHILRALATPHADTAALGIATLLLLTLTRRYLAPLLRALGCGAGLAQLVPKLMPMLAVGAALFMADRWRWHELRGIAVVGAIPQGLPTLQLPLSAGPLIGALLFPAFTIGLINFVSSITVAQTLALKRRQRIDADAELRALGAANIASAISGGFPVNGGFARSLVSFNAGAQTPLAGVVSALLMALIVATCAQLFSALPVTVLAATIIVAVAPVIDIGAFQRTWRYDRADALALAGTAIGVVALGVESGIAIGIGVALMSLVWRSGHPHIAVLGRVPYSEHFRNVLRYKTETLPQVVALRIDENLVFANAQAVEARVRAELKAQTQQVLLVMSSVSQIDTTALDMLIELNDYLRSLGMRLHFAELKGPVLERLQQSPLLRQLSGKIFLSTHKAFQEFASSADDYVI